DRLTAYFLAAANYLGEGVARLDFVTRGCRYRFFFASRRRHTRLVSDWSSDVCSSDLRGLARCFSPTRPRPVPLRRLQAAESWGEIGRASCRERGWILGGGAYIKEEK